jgi:hypothetical protein
MMFSRCSLLSSIQLKPPRYEQRQRLVCKQLRHFKGIRWYRDSIPFIGVGSTVAIVAASFWNTGE